MMQALIFDVLDYRRAAYYYAFFTDNVLGTGLAKFSVGCLTEFIGSLSCYDLRYNWWRIHCLFQDVRGVHRYAFISLNGDDTVETVDNGIVMFYL